MNQIKALFLSFRDACDAFRLRRIMSGLMGRSAWHDLRRFPRDFITYYKQYRNRTKEDFQREFALLSGTISKCTSGRNTSHPVISHGTTGAGRARYTVLPSMRSDPGQQP